MNLGQAGNKRPLWPLDAALAPREKKERKKGNLGRVRKAEHGLLIIGRLIQQEIWGGGRVCSLSLNPDCPHISRGFPDRPGRGRPRLASQRSTVARRVLSPDKPEPGITETGNQPSYASFSALSFISQGLFSGAVSDARRTERRKK